jgi:hypothetical protein
VSGLAAIALLMVGLQAIGGPRVALFGGALLATNYIFVMWNRAALMESTMTACIVAGWAWYAAAARRPALGLAAGAAAALAWFTKAAAAFFVAALVLDALLTLALAALPALRRRLRIDAPDPASVRGAWLTLAGLAIVAGLIAAIFVVPYWSEYRFYNWQMSVTRKPSYAIADLMTRASWLPVVQDFFSRMWLVLLAAMLALGGILARCRAAVPGERLLVLWVLVGLAELVVHDSGSERRYVMFIPALVALASLLVAGGAAVVPAALARAGWRARLAALPFVLLAGYLAYGSLVRLAWLDDVRAGEFSTVVRLSAALAGVTAAVLLLRWRTLVGRLAQLRVPPAVAAAVLAVSLAWNLGSYAHWALMRTSLNYEASVALGRLLPAGTLVQGKLANGLALDNAIRPIFIGNAFGNFDDRLNRDDVRYILTYTEPALGYESGQDGLLIRELLAHYPDHHLVTTFTVEETAGPDVASLFAKSPGEPRARD